MSRKVNLRVFAPSAAALLALVGLATAASLPANGNSTAPSSPIVLAEDTKGLEELDAADRAAAEKQKTCPVTDELLGSMGKPVKVTAKGRDVYLCCGGCKGKFLKNVDKYLEKIDKQSKK